MDILEIIGRAFFSALVLFIFTKIMGKKQISQLNFFDYVLGITIGSIAAQMAFDRELPFHYPIIAMGIYTICEVAISFFSNKSLRFRHLFIGTPLVIVEEGVLIEKNLKKSRLDVNEFLAQVRKAGYFNLSDVYYAVQETSGSLSIIPKSSVKPASVSDMNLVVKQEGLCANLIIDGQIIDENLRNSGHDEKWLMNRLREKNIKDISSVLLAICDSSGSLSVYEKNIPGSKTGSIK